MTDLPVRREGDCLIWEGPRTGGGAQYGSFKNRIAHRVIYEEHHGIKVPQWDVVHHSCGNKLCVNVDHLQRLTRSEHRRLHQPGSVGVAKASLIKRLHADLCDVTPRRKLTRKLAELTGVTMNQVREIMAGRLHPESEPLPEVDWTLKHAS